eukprot:1153862-Pelagomonas_calceolata.AAC.10
MPVSRTQDHAQRLADHAQKDELLALLFLSCPQFKCSKACAPYLMCTLLYLKQSIGLGLWSKGLIASCQGVHVYVFQMACLLAISPQCGSTPSYQLCQRKYKYAFLCQLTQRQRICMASWASKNLWHTGKGDVADCIKLKNSSDGSCLVFGASIAHTYAQLEQIDYAHPHVREITGWQEIFLLGFLTQPDSREVGKFPFIAGHAPSRASFSSPCQP